MIDQIISFFVDHAPHAHYIIFGALILAGFNLPVSEDLMVIISAILASTIIPEHLFRLCIFLFLGCYLSDLIVYWLGRSLSQKLFQIKWFAKTFSKKRMNKAQQFYHKHGLYTLMLGRFIPFGIRNALFMTAGMGKMPFGKFMISDFIACLISNTVLFSITYALGINYSEIFRHLKTFKYSVFILFVFTLISVIWYYQKRSKFVKIKKKGVDLEETI